MKVADRLSSGFPLVAYVFTGFAPGQLQRLHPRQAGLLTPPDEARQGFPVPEQHVP